MFCMMQFIAVLWFNWVQNLIILVQKIAIFELLSVKSKLSLKVSCRFQPDYREVINLTDLSSSLMKTLHFFTICRCTNLTESVPAKVKWGTEDLSNVLGHASSMTKTMVWRGHSEISQVKILLCKRQVLVLSTVSLQHFQSSKSDFVPQAFWIFAGF